MILVSTSLFDGMDLYLFGTMLPRTRRNRSTQQVHELPSIMYSSQASLFLSLLRCNDKDYAVLIDQRFRCHGKHPTPDLIAYSAQCFIGDDCIWGFAAYLHVFLSIYTAVFPFYLQLPIKMKHILF